MLLLVFLSIILFCVLEYTRRTRHTQRCLAKLPTYPRLPITGNFHKVFGGPRFMYHRLVEMSTMSEESQLPFVIWLGPVPLMYNSKRKFKCIMDTLLELNERDPTFSIKQIRNEVDTIILGGQETVASTICYVLLMIGCKHDVQEKIYAEIKEIFGDSKRDVNKKDLTRLSYCEAVINETLRLYPPVPGAFRYADHDLQLKLCTVPKGAKCFVNFWGVGRSKRYWGADALEFRPERWYSSDIPNEALLAFSTGKRACIGRKYAMPIMKTFVAHCVRELMFMSEADKMEMKIEMAIRPVNGHLLKVRLREE